MTARHRPWLKSPGAVLQRARYVSASPPATRVSGGRMRLGGPIDPGHPPSHPRSPGSRAIPGPPGRLPVFESEGFTPGPRDDSIQVRCRAPVARQAHNLEVGGSIPPGATPKAKRPPRGGRCRFEGRSSGSRFPREIGPASLCAPDRPLNDIQRPLSPGNRSPTFSLSPWHPSRPGPARRRLPGRRGCPRPGRSCGGK
jgi:hypothetical protein